MAPSTGAIRASGSCEPESGPWLAEVSYALQRPDVARSLRWSQLVPGLITALVLVAVTLAVLLFAKVGAASGDTMRVYTAMSAARGVMKGSEVWLHGYPVGVVQSIQFLPASAPLAKRLLVTLDVGEQFRPFIRLDSDAQIRAGGSLIGAPVIYITGGTPGARPIGDGDTLIAQAQADVEGITGEFALAARELPAIMQNVRMIRTQLRAATGTIGAFTSEEGVELGGVQERGMRIASRLRGGRGTLGLAFGGRGALMARARSAMASADSVRQLLAEGRGELGRFRRDSTLIRAVGEIRDELALVRALLDEPRGTAGRLKHDRAIALELAAADTAMQLLFADIKSRPLRYLHLF